MSGQLPRELDDVNPIREARMKKDGALIIERTPERPKTLTTTFVITEIEAEIAKIDGVIELWQAKKAPLQAIVDEYVEMA